MRLLEARITWNTESNGCIEQPWSGMQPSMLVAGDLVMSRIEGKDSVTRMERGKSYDVVITLPYGEFYDEHLAQGMDIRLQVGARVIATGTVTFVHSNR